MGLCCYRRFRGNCFAAASESDLLGGRRLTDALKVFQLLVKEFPDSPNAWDSLGEAYATKGDRQQAIASYQKCLALNPKSDNARKWLEKLQQSQ